MEGFPCPEDRFLAFCANLLLCSLFFQTFLEMGQRCQGSWVVLILPFSPCSLLGFIAALLLSCVALLSRD